MQVRLLYEVGESQGIERETRKLRDVMVGDGSCVQLAYLLSRNERPAR